MAITYAVINQKGGVGKSITTQNIATVKAMEGNRVLMVDLDPQASLTIMCGVEPYSEKYDVCNIFERSHEKGWTVRDSRMWLEQITGIKRLDLIPSRLDLADMSLDLVSRYSREYILLKALADLQDEYDFIFIDCPPELGMLSINALCAADKVIIPLTATYVSYRGLESLRRTIKDIQQQLNPELVIQGAICTLYEKNINDQQDILEMIKQPIPEFVLGVVKKSADAYRDVVTGKAVVQTKPNCDVAKSYKEIAKLIY